MIYNQTKSGLDRFGTPGTRDWSPRKRLTDQEVLDEVNARSSSGSGGINPAFQSLNREWAVNVAYYIGLQNDELADMARFPDLDMAMKIPKRNYTANRILRAVQQQVSRLARNRGEVEVPPDTPDHRDQMAAKVGEDWLSHLHYELQIPHMLEDLLLWAVCCGNAFPYVGWDPYKGEVERRYWNPFEKRYQSEGETPDGDREGLAGMGLAEDISKGDFDVEALTPFQVLVPSEFIKMDSAPWMVIERVVSPDWIADRWPTKFRNLHVGQSSVDPRTTYWRRLATLVASKGFATSGLGYETDESLVVKELWRPPSKLVKEGCYALVCQSEVLENLPHRFARDGIKRRFPVSHLRYNRVPGRLWGESLVSQLIDPQREFNKGRTQIIQQRDRLSHPQWLLPKTAQLTSTRNEYGDFLTYSGGARPELQNPPALSQAHQDTIERADRDIQTLSAQNEASQSQAPASVRSGSLHRSLMAADMEVLGLVVSDLERVSAEMNSALLQLSGKYVTSARIMKKYGRGRVIDVTYFKGEQLRGNNTARVVQGTMEPRSDLEQQETIESLLSIGGLDPANPEDRRLIREKMKLGTPESDTMEERQRRNARIENEAFREPKMNPRTGTFEGFPEVDEMVDDHQVHIDEHRMLMIDDDFKYWPIERQMAVRAHVQKHSMAITAMVEAQQALAGPAMGPGGGSPPAPVGEAPQPRPRQKTPGTESAR